MTLRILDTGLRPARWNVGMTAALAELHRTGRVGDTLRFYRAPPAVLLGQHQNPKRAVDLAVCRRLNIDIARRMTGGGAGYVSPGILGFDLIAERRDFGPSLSNAIAWICTGLAAGIARIGLPARYQPSGQVVIDGRVIGRVTGTYNGLTLIVQGFVHIDAEAEPSRTGRRSKAGQRAPLEFMRPPEQLSGLSDFLGRVMQPEEIVGILAAGLADKLKRAFTTVEIGAEQAELAERFASDMEADPLALSTSSPDRGMLVARQRAESGYIEARVRLAPGAREIDEVRLAGDFSIAPTHAIHDLEMALRGLPAEAAADRARALLEQSIVTISGVAPADIAAVIDAAVKSKPARAP
jgi:lipoate-protein ligase A